MGLKKGQTNNPSGRPKGSRNKDNEFVNKIKEGVPVEKVLELIEKIKEPSAKVDRLLRLIEFAYPKKKAVEHSGEIEGANIIQVEYINSADK